MTDLPAGATDQRTIQDRVTDIYTWMREPDYTDEASIEWLTDWVNRRPSADLAMVAILMPAAVPAGSVVVPREATELMANAAELAYPATFQGMWTAAIEVSAITPGERHE